MGLFDFLSKTAATPVFNPNDQMQGFYAPTDEERRQARKMAALQAGAGLLMNNTGNYGAFAPALGAGIAQGIQGYQQGLNAGPERRMKEMQQRLYGMQVQAQAQRAAQEAQDEKDAAEESKLFFASMGIDPGNMQGSFMPVSGARPIPDAQLDMSAMPQGIVAKPKEQTGIDIQTNAPLYSQQEFGAPVAAQPPQIDQVLDELGYTPGMKKMFYAHAKSNPKAAETKIQKEVTDYLRAQRSGRREARDVIAKDRAIAEAMGIPLKEYLTNKANKSGVNVTVPVSYGAFTSAVDAQGNPVFIQPSKSGGAPNVVQGFMPADDAAKQRQSADAARTRLSSLDRLESDIQDLLEAPGLKYAVGMYSLAPIVPGTSQADAIADIENLASRAAVQAIADMREASKTGGAVGQVTEKEWPKLEAQLANLKRAQSFTKFQTELRKFQDLVRNSKRLIEEAQRKSPMPAARPSQAKPVGQPADPLGIRR